MALLACCAVAAFGQQSAAPIIEPGAPGQASQPVSAETASATQNREPSKADIDFMQGMIMHHGQAVEMTQLLRTRSQNKEVQELGARIRVSQSDEMRWMKQWLQERGKPESMPGMDSMMTEHGNMPGMDMGAMSMPMMPGMLTPKQMTALTRAKGPAFDHLFLTGMIQHHTGALTMVQDLFNTPAAAQDAQLFDFVTDVDNTQRAEIRIMQGLLNRK